MSRFLSLLLFSLISINVHSSMLAPYVDELGMYSYEPDSQSKEARRYFKQGLLLFWDFQYTEANRSFKAAINEDENCGMCYYMLALSYGSVTNAPLTGGERFLAIGAISQGLKRPVISQKARDLLTALVNRYYLGQKQVQKQYQLAPFYLSSKNERETYMESMRDVAKKYPKDLEIQAQFAFSLYDIDRGNLWNENKMPKHYTQALFEVLDKIYEKEKLHPGVLHLYIAALTESDNPSEALPYAKLLKTNFPGFSTALIASAKNDIHTGRIHVAMEDVEQSIASFNRYKNDIKHQGFIPSTSFLQQEYYYNLWHTALLQGRYQTALQSSSMLEKLTPSYALDDAPELQLYLTLSYFNTVYFKKYRQALKLKEPQVNLPLVKAAWYFSSGMAFLELNQVKDATITLQNLRGLQENHEKDLLFKRSLGLQIGIIADILEANISEKNKNVPLAIEQWKHAYQSLKDIPSFATPLYTHMIQLGLGKAYLKLKKTHKAIVTLNHYLTEYPKNPWAMRVLSEAYHQSNEYERSISTFKDSMTAWRFADQPLSYLI